jgi:hypothetical protein
LTESFMLKIKTIYRKYRQKMNLIKALIQTWMP